MKIPIFNLILISSIFIFLLSFLIHPDTAITQDLGRHLKMGEIIWQTKSVPKTNLFAYTFPDFPFINHHWLPEVVFFLVNQAGINTLNLFKILIITTSYIIVYKLASKKAGWLTISVVSLLFLPVAQERTEIRPEIFSFLFFSLYLLILGTGKKTKLIWLLPLIQLVWVNSHLYFFVGPVLFSFFFFSQLMSREKTYQLPKLLLVGLLILLVNLINPNGLKGATYPLAVFNNYGYQIVENQSPFFLEKIGYFPYITFFKLCLGLLVISFTLNFKKINFFNFCLAVFLSIWLSF